MHVHTHMHTHTHTHTHMHAHTHTHKCTHTLSLSLLDVVVIFELSNKITDCTSDQLLLSSPVYADHNRKILEITN